jgi:hypothetical protein
MFCATDIGTSKPPAWAARLIFRQTVALRPIERGNFEIHKGAFAGVETWDAQSFGSTGVSNARLSPNLDNPFVDMFLTSRLKLRVHTSRSTTAWLGYCLKTQDRMRPGHRWREKWPANRRKSQQSIWSARGSKTERES